MGVYVNEDGIRNAQGRLVQRAYGSHHGARINLGFFGATGHNFIHVKTSAGGSSDQMHKFEYNGYTYSHLNVHNSVTFYTYAAQSTPYQPSLVNWGESGGGIVNYYYSSSDDKVVIVLGTNNSYTGGFLYHQSGKSHTDFDVAVLAHTSNASSSSGVY